MTFWRRLKLYGFGFLLGLLVVWALFGNRSCTTPNEIKIMELASQRFVLSEKAVCKLRCMKKNEALLKLEMRHFRVNYGLSEVRKEPCGEYYLEPLAEYSSNYPYKFIVYDCDTLTKIGDFQTIDELNCNCP